MKHVLLAALMIAGYAFPHTNDVTKKPVSDTLMIGNKTLEIYNAPFSVSKAMNSRVPMHGVAGYSQQGRPIQAYYFPGTSDKKALVIGGVHGSELSAIEVAKTLIDQLEQADDLYYSIIVIPCLFPDNAFNAESNKSQINAVSNIGRYSQYDAADPNRQMPALGAGFHSNNPFDFGGRPIEPENQLMLNVIQEFRPGRIVNLHSIRLAERAGVYADPRTDSKGLALGFETDSNLAIDMAKYIEANGGYTPGNDLHGKPSALYYADPVAAGAGKKQKRNLHGSKLPGNRGFGVSLGSWASTAVDDPLNDTYNRPAIRLITMEFPGCKRPSDYTDPLIQFNCKKEVELYAASIKNVFLQENYVE